MKQIDQNNETVGGFTVEIMVLSREKEVFEEKCARVESTANAIGCRIRIMSHLQKEAFMHLSPTYSSQLKIQEISERPFLISTFTGGFPYATSGFYDETGYYLGKNGNGGVILFDLWKRDESRTNSNITILGDIGMGKSTALKHIIYSEIARGTKVIRDDVLKGKCVVGYAHNGEYVSSELSYSHDFSVYVHNYDKLGTTPHLSIAINFINGYCDTAPSNNGYNGIRNGQNDDALVNPLIWFKSFRTDIVNEALVGLAVADGNADEAEYEKEVETDE